MAHFLTACIKANELLVPLYNTMYSSNLKPEERDKLFNAESLYTLKLLADVEKQFYTKDLCPVDKENHLASITYYITQSTADRISTIDTPNTNKTVDETVQGQNFILCLSNTHKPNKNHTNQEKLEHLKTKLGEIKVKVTENLESNIRDQMGENTFYYHWFALDLVNIIFIP